jgi:hypothetical protein
LGRDAADLGAMRGFPVSGVAQEHAVLVEAVHVLPPLALHCMSGSNPAALDHAEPQA